MEFFACIVNNFLMNGNHGNFNFFVNNRCLGDRRLPKWRIFYLRKNISINRDGRLPRVKNLPEIITEIARCNRIYFKSNWNGCLLYKIHTKKFKRNQKSSKFLR